MSPPHFCIPSMGTARAPYHPEGDTPYLVPEADASRQGRRCPGGCHRHQWVTGSARGPGRRWWCGDSSAPCRHSMRPAGTGPTRHSCGFMMSPPNVPVSSPPPPPYLGHGAAPPGAIRCHAAGGIIGTLGLSVGTRDSTRGCGEWEWGEGPPYPLSSPHQAHPRAAPPIPRDVMQELPSALQRDPRGQQWRPPAQGTPWGERRGGGRAAGGGKAPPPPPNGRERGGETEAH